MLRRCTFKQNSLICVELPILFVLYSSTIGGNMILAGFCDTIIDYCGRDGNAQGKEQIEFHYICSWDTQCGNTVTIHAIWLDTNTLIQGQLYSLHIQV